PGAAGNRQDYSALVRRIGGRLDHLPALLSIGPAAGIPLCARRDPLPEAPHADDGARGASPGERGRPSDLSEPRLEAHGKRTAYFRHCESPRHLGGSAVFPAFDHRSAATGLVRTPLQGLDALPALRAVECRLHVCAAELSGAL